MTALAEAAAALAARGVFVFPVRGKAPLTTRGYLDAVGTRDEVRSLFGRHPDATGIGLACGSSGVLVVDVDGRIGEDTWVGLEREHGHTPTLEVGTGRPDGGRHLYFITTDPRSRNTAGRLGAGIDTRGRGGYVICPPSLHPSGASYRWLTRRPAAPAPEWLLNCIQPPHPVTIGVRRSIPDGKQCDRYGRVALERQADDMLNAVEGTRHATLAGVAYRAGRLAAAGHLERSLAEDVLVPAAIAVGLDEREAVRTFDDCFNAGLELPVATTGDR